MNAFYERQQTRPGDNLDTVRPCKYLGIIYPNRTTARLYRVHTQTVLKNVHTRNSDSKILRLSNVTLKVRASKSTIAANTGFSGRVG